MTNDVLRRLALYDYLVAKGDTWTPQREIVSDMCEFYEPKQGEDGKSFHQSTARRLLTSDIKAINLDTEKEKVIITGSRGVKIATKEEGIQHLNRIYAANMRRLYYAKIIRTKMGLDGQYTDAENNHIEAFIEKNIGGQVNGL